MPIFWLQQVKLSMPFSDLDLEFEDEDEVPRAPTPAPAKAQVQAVQTSTQPSIKKPEPEAPRPKAQGTTPSIPRPALKASQEATDPDLREQMRKLQIEAEVKVQLAEFKLTYLADLLSDLKLVDHQIGQVLNRINAKHPEAKNELLMIKKILADFIAKKRK